MKKLLGLLVMGLLVLVEVNAQKVAVDPTITPAQFRYNDQITVTYDVTGTAMAALTDAWVWVWIPNTNIGAPYDVDPATTVADPAKCTKSIVSGKTLFSITFTPSAFFSSDISAQTQMGILLKANTWSAGQTTDYIASFWDGTFQVKLISPTVQPLFVTNGNTIQIQATAPATADYTLYLNNVLINTQAAQTNYSYSLVVNDTVAFYTVKITATANSLSSTATFTYNIRKPSPVLARPAGIIDGINYNAADQTRATLCFWAPNKTSVYAFGDFTDWTINPKYLMNKDGEHFWVEITGLTPGTEYAFQYLVNDTLRIADPYTDKILEPEDNQIPATTYPNLKTIPAKAFSSQWYYNHFSVLQTGQTPYQWQTSNYTRPAKEKLVVYELLIRDYFDSNHRNFQTLIDTISYFKRLGINAIELMPVTEFNGEIGWGYNPTSMFAVQKYYGHKNKFKEFVDKCHANGIAVIMDLVMNHQDLPNAYCMLDYDFVNNHPKSTNKWFNVAAPHPYSVFNDLNHDSPYTRKYLDTINYYWVNEFKIDGYRYDLSKGFTQTVSTEATVGNYDPSRVYNLTRMADKLWLNFPDTYVILEHFATNYEETWLANYRVNEGKGMMLWGNLNYAYGQNTMGYSSNSDLGWMYYGNRGWTAPRAVGYMESHDEEREMYRNINFGVASGSYDVKTLTNALERMKTAAAFFYPIPGPKMIWEFGEMGYDFSINTCTDGTVNNNCRLSEKPVHWDYLNDPLRKNLFLVNAALINLRNTYPVFQTSSVTNFSLQGGSSLVKQIIIKSTPYNSNPTSTDNMNVVIVGNFDVTVQPVSANFPHTGNWFHYFSQGDTLSVTASPQTINLQPGEFRIYTDVSLPKTAKELTAFVRPNAPQLNTVQQVDISVQLSWTDNSTIETGFNIYRRKAGQAYAKVGQVGANTTTYTDSQGLTSGTQYDYYVEAANGYAGVASNTKSITTGNVTEVSSLRETTIFYPNPTSGVISVDRSVDVAELSLLSLQGMKVTPRRLDHYSWSVGDVSSGMYIVEYRTAEGTFRVKLVKN